jgi:hypothetical protein
MSETKKNGNWNNPLVLRIVAGGAALALGINLFGLLRTIVDPDGVKEAEKASFLATVKNLRELSLENGNPNNSSYLAGLNDAERQDYNVLLKEKQKHEIVNSLLFGTIAIITWRRYKALEPA